MQWKKSIFTSKIIVIFFFFFLFLFLFSLTRITTVDLLIDWLSLSDILTALLYFPYLTSPYLTLPYLILACLTSPNLISSYQAGDVEDQSNVWKCLRSRNRVQKWPVVSLPPSHPTLGRRVTTFKAFLCRFTYLLFNDELLAFPFVLFHSTHPPRRLLDWHPIY